MKQVILVCGDLSMSRAKTAIQVAHASVEAVLKSDKKKVQEWRKFSKKVILKVKDEKELIRFKKLADKSKLVTALIKDAGLTEIPPGTITSLAIGPDDDEKIDKITGKLKTL